MKKFLNRIAKKINKWIYQLSLKKSYNREWTAEEILEREG